MPDLSPIAGRRFPGARASRAFLFSDDLMFYMVCRNPGTGKDIPKRKCALSDKEHNEHAHVIYVRYLVRSTGKKSGKATRLPDGTSLYYPAKSYYRARLDCDRFRGILKEHEYSIRHGRECRADCVFCCTSTGSANATLTFDEFKDGILRLAASPHLTNVGKLKELRQITCDGYRYSLNKLQRALGDDITFPLSQAQINEFIRKRIAAGISPRTVNYDLRSLRAVLNLAVTHKILPEGSTPVIALFDLDDRAIEILTREQVVAVEAAATKRGYLYQLAVYALMYQGLRPGDLSPYRQNTPQGIKWKHVDFDRHLIGVMGKTERASVKWLPMNSRLEMILRSRPAECKPEERIFPYSRHKLWEMVKEIFRDAGVAHCNPYILRKTFVSYFAEVAGVDSAREAARHSDINTTQRFYNRVRWERQYKGHDDLLAFFDGVKNDTGRDSSRDAEETIKRLLAQHPELMQKFGTVPGVA